MAKLRENFQSGLITDNPLSDSATTINSDEFANLPAVTGGDTLTLILDPEGAGNGPEIVTVTAHTASATAVTVTRGVESTSAVEHAQSTPWIHGPTAGDWDEAATHNHDDDYSATGHGHAAAVAGSSNGFLTAADKTKLDGIESGATADQSAADIRALGFFDITNDGAGSGLDADKLDGLEASALALASHEHSLNQLSNVTLSGVADNEVLAYDSGTSLWKNQTAAEAGLAAASHTHTASQITDLLTSLKASLPGLLLANGNTGLVAADGALTGSFANLKTSTVTLPYSGETVVVTVTAEMRIATALAGQGFGLRLRTPEVGTEEIDYAYLYVPDITDPQHEHNIPSATPTISGYTEWTEPPGDTNHRHLGVGTLALTGHDHGDADAASTGITADGLDYVFLTLTEVWGFTVTGTQFDIQLDGRHYGSGGQTPDVAIKYTVHRAWS